MLTTDAIEEQLAGYRQAGDAHLPECPLVLPAFRPIPPHRVGVAHLLLRPRFFLLDPTGTGKTPQTLVAYAYLRQQRPMRLIVLTRKSALFQWRASVERFLHGVKAEVVGYDPRDPTIEWRVSQRQAQYARWITGEVDVLISTYATLALDWTVKGKPVSDGRRKAKPTRDWAFDPKTLPEYALAVDEVHNLRGHRGKVFYPAIAAVSKQARYAWGLTATPLFKKIEDLYGIVELIRPGTLSPETEFAELYLRRMLMTSRQHGKKFWKVLGSKNEQHLIGRLRPYFLQRPIEVFDKYLPDVITQTVMVDLSPAQRALYERVAKQFYPAPVDLTTGTATHIAQQIAKSGFTIPQKMTSLLYAQLALDAPRALGVPDVPSAKLDELVRYLSEEGEPESVIIYTRFEQVASIIYDTLKKDGQAVVRITGKESGAARRTAQEDFQSGKAQRVIVTSAGGEALDLQAARVLVFYDLPMSWGEFAQIIGRARRTGSVHRSILLLLLGTTHTLETKTLASLQQTESLVAATFSLSDFLLKAASFTERNEAHSISAGALSADLFTSSSTVAALFDALYSEINPFES